MFTLHTDTTIHGMLQSSHNVTTKKDKLAVDSDKIITRSNAIMAEAGQVKQVL